MNQISKLFSSYSWFSGTSCPNKVPQTLTRIPMQFVHLKLHYSLHLNTTYHIIKFSPWLVLDSKITRCLSDIAGQDLKDDESMPLSPNGRPSNPLPTNEQQSSTQGHAVAPAVAGRAPTSASAAVPTVIMPRIFVLRLLLPILLLHLLAQTWFVDSTSPTWGFPFSAWPSYPVNLLARAQRYIYIYMSDIIYRWRRYWSWPMLLAFLSSIGDRFHCDPHGPLGVY